MNVISNILYWISTGLLVPVIVLLIIFFVRALLLTGAFFSRYLIEHKSGEKLYVQVRTLTPENVGELAAALPAKKIIECAGNEARIDFLLSEYEMAADKDIATSKTLTKMGPILGLMGTLIPMGPALTGLASGDIASMAYNMQVAFATTVVGLVISAIGFITQQAKERRAVKDLTILEFIAENLKQNN